MSNVVLSKTQSKEIAKEVYGDIKNYVEQNFEKFMLFYRDELMQAQGRPIEPIAIKFTPCFSDWVALAEDDTGKENDKPLSNSINTN